MFPTIFSPLKWQFQLGQFIAFVFEGAHLSSLATAEQTEFAISRVAWCGSASPFVGQWVQFDWVSSHDGSHCSTLKRTMAMRDTLFCWYCKCLDHNSNIVLCSKSHHGMRGHAWDLPHSCPSISSTKIASSQNAFRLSVTFCSIPCPLIIGPYHSHDFIVCSASVTHPKTVLFSGLSHSIVTQSTPTNRKIFSSTWLHCQHSYVTHHFLPFSCHLFLHTCHTLCVCCWQFLLFTVSLLWWCWNGSGMGLKLASGGAYQNWWKDMVSWMFFVIVLCKFFLGLSKVSHLLTFASGREEQTQIAFFSLPILALYAVKTKVLANPNLGWGVNTTILFTSPTVWTSGLVFCTVLVSLSLERMSSLTKTLSLLFSKVCPSPPFSLDWLGLLGGGGSYEKDDSKSYGNLCCECVTKRYESFGAARGAVPTSLKLQSYPSRSKAMIEIAYRILCWDCGCCYK